MNSKYYFILDLHSTQSQISLPAMKGDTAREWRISFSDGGNPVVLEDGVLAKLEIKRPTGTFINEFCPIENNTTVVYKFLQNENTAAVDGVHDCNVVLYSAEGGVLGSAKFTMVVSPRAIDSDDINLSEDDRTAIDAILQAEAARESAERSRINAESERVTAEASRVTAENARKTAVEEALDDVDDKIAEVDKMVTDGDFDGFSPTVKTEAVSGGTRVTITDKTGDHAFVILNGTNGSDGDNGADGSLVDYRISTTLNTDNYTLTVAITDTEGNIINSDTVDFPLESVVTDVKEENGIITITLQNGNTASYDITDLVNGLVAQKDYDAKMEEIDTAISNRYTKEETDTAISTAIADAITTTLNTDVEV